MMKYKFNLNYYMYVKLTDFGKQKIIEENGYGYFKYCIESQKQSDGYYKLQAHAIMNLLGKYFVNGNPNLPLDLTVYFADEYLEVEE